MKPGRPGKRQNRTRDPRRMTDRVYRITVEGELGEEAALAFDGMAASCEAGNTVLVGRIRDQAQLTASSSACPTSD